MGLSEDFFRELMYVHDASKVTKACHDNLCILKGMLEEFNPNSIPTINDVTLFKHVLSTIVMQASLLSDSAEELKKKYPDILGQEGGDS